MAKTNFTKVEEALEKGLLKMNISGLIDIAEMASQTGGPNTHVMHDLARRKLLIAALLFEINHGKDEKLFSAIGISRQELKALLQSPDEITPENWTALLDFKEKIDAYKKNIEANQPEDADEKLVEAQRKRHINKRYNTKEKWLPLH